MNNMKKEDLFNAMNDIEDDLLIRSENGIKGKKKEKKMALRKITGGVVAAAVMAVALVGVDKMGLFDREVEPGSIHTSTSKPTSKPTSTPTDKPKDEVMKDVIDAAAGGRGEEKEENKKHFGFKGTGEIDFVYTGTIHPLTLENANDYVTASRFTNFDFNKFDSFENEGYALIKDKYILKNNSGEDQIIKVMYPSNVVFADIYESTPKVYVDGKEVETEINMSSGYLDDRLSYDFDLSILDEKVVVYEYQCSDDVKDGMFTAQMWIENEKKQEYYSHLELEDNIYYANMSAHYVKGHTEYYGFKTEDVKNTGKTPMLIFYGEEPKEYREQAFDGYIWSEETKTELDVKMVRYESTFREVLAKIIEESGFCEESNDELNALFYEFCGAYLADVIRENNNGEDDLEKGNAYWFENSIDGLIYLLYDMGKFDITNEIVVPAGGEISYEIEYYRQGNHDKTIPETEDLGKYGFDSLTIGESILNFDEQVASIDDHGYIEILEQNYGFDLENDVREVTLDMMVDYYYMVVRRIVE